MNVISVRKSNLNDICRVCLSASNAPFTDIFSTGSSNLATTIAAAVMECAPVHINQGDGLPTLICSSCNNHLEISHQFRTQCIRSESILQRYVAHLNTDNTQTITETFITETIEEKDVNDPNQHQNEVHIIEKTVDDQQQQQIDENGMYIKQECVEIKQECGNDENTAIVQNIQTLPPHTSIIKEITTTQIIDKATANFNQATVLKQEIITEAEGAEIKLKLNTDGNCYQLQGAIENACFSTDQTQEIQYRFFNPIVGGNTDGQIIKVNSIEKTNTVNNSTNTIPEQNFESYLVKLFTKEEERPHKCNVCLKTFKRSSNLSEHAKVHSECRPYKCEVCQKLFKRSCDLAEHKRSHSNERPFKCTICPKSFKRNCDLSEHMKIHTNERPFECDICHKGFKRNGQYLEHRRIHTGERPYECEVCHQHFRTSSKLSAHSRIHNEERNHKCTLCSKSFRSYKSLTIHSRVHLDQ
ncbi:zinc finger protein 880-like [Chrysoperla carnea]|uniref:zinc finger protein 880-like n=1 Tax=Chrysoperla carnea TaxID=189513 RepID=UPI001D0751FC|nr:zinc finger protein 880-like [Chrysoperla carnea]